jgi:sphingomyelin phosphodiesterase
VNQRVFSTFYPSLKKVWIIGHVLSGYTGSDALPNPTALFYSIVRRFSPSTIAGIFWGHSHEDELMIYYDYNPSSLSSTGLRNTTDIDYASPLNVGFVGPSVTPLTGYNAGWRVYQVDSSTFSVVDFQTYYANVSESNEWTIPEWRFEYDARATYDPDGSWGENDPLNATFWNDVTINMLTNISLVETYNLFETKVELIKGIVTMLIIDECPYK